MAVILDLPEYGSLILAVSWAIAAVAILLIAARFFTAFTITQRFKADIYVATINFAVVLVAQLALTVSVKWGLGKHIYELSPEEQRQSLLWAWVFQIIDVMCMALGKIAIIAFLIQLRGPHDPHPWLLWFVGVTSFIASAVTVIFILLVCQPVAKLYDTLLPGVCPGHQRNQYFAFFSGSWASLCDLTLAIYPIFICSKLHVQLHVKVGLCILMGFGIIAAICSAIRTSELTSLGHTNDHTYFLSPLIIWTSTETWIIVIVGCVPALRPLFTHLFDLLAPNMTTSRDRSFTRIKFSRQGTQIPSDKLFDLPEMNGRYEDEVYRGVEDYDGAHGTHATAGPLAGDCKSWADVQDDQIVMTTNIDVDYNDRFQSGNGKTCLSESRGDDRV